MRWLVKITMVTWTPEHNLSAKSYSECSRSVKNYIMTDLGSVFVFLLGFTFSYITGWQLLIINLWHSDCQSAIGKHCTNICFMTKNTIRCYFSCIYHKYRLFLFALIVNLGGWATSKGITKLLHMSENPKYLFDIM